MRAIGRAQARQVNRVGGETDLGVAGFKAVVKEAVAKQEVPQHCVHCHLMRSQLQELEARLEHAEETLEDEQRWPQSFSTSTLTPPLCAAELTAPT